MTPEIEKANEPANSSDCAVADQNGISQQELMLALRPYILKCLSLNHDINNPLAGIIGYGEILSEDESLTPEQKGYLKQIMTCAERIRAKVNELCDSKVALQGELDIRQAIEMLSDKNPE